VAASNLFELINNGTICESLRLTGSSGQPIVGHPFQPSLSSPTGTPGGYEVASAPQLTSATTYTVFVDLATATVAGCPPGSGTSYNAGTFTTR